MGVITNLLIGIGMDPAGIEEGASEGEGMLRSAAKGFAVAGAAIGAATVAGIVGAMNVDAANDKLAAQLGLSGADAERAGQVASKLYAGAWGENIGEVNDAVGAVISSIDGMATASSSDLEAVTAKALDFATAFETDVARSSQIAGQLIRTGLATDATQAFDLITAASTKVPANIREDVIDAADEYGQFFATLGYSGEQAFAMLVDGSEKGMFGIDKVGDAIKEFTILSTDMSTGSQEAYAAIGLDAETMANKILAGGGSAAQGTQQIVDGLLAMKDPASQAQAAIALFGTPLEDLNATEIPAFLTSLKGGSESMADFEGASERMGKTLNDNATTNLESFKRQIQTAFIDFVGGKALPIVNDMAERLAVGFGPALADVGAFLRDDVLPAAQDFFGFLAEHETTVTIIAGLVGGVLATALTVWATRSVIAAATNTIAWFTTATASTASATVQSRSAMQVVVGWIWMGTQSLIAAARVAASWVIAMGPIGWAIAAVVGLVALIVWKWDEVKAITARVWDWFSSKISDVWNAVTGWIGRKVGEVLGFIGRMAAVPGVVAGFFGSMKDRAVAKGAELVTWVAGMPGRVLSGLGDLGGLLVGAGGDIVRGLWDGISAMGDWIVGKLGDFVSDVIPGPIKDVLGIASPSKVTAELGRWTGRGLVDGLLGTAGEVSAASEVLAAAAVPALDDPSYGVPSGYAAGVSRVDPYGADAGDRASSGIDYQRLAQVLVAALHAWPQEIRLDLNNLTLARWFLAAAAAAEAHA